jgi:hypothetical protein
MLHRRQYRFAWFIGLVLLAVAQVGHAYEHWEIVVHKACVAHAEADHGDDAGARHDHGCASHDHAPALMGCIFSLTITETVSLVSSESLGGPAPHAASIDHPPQLS